MFISPSPGCCGIFGFLILYSLCQYVENLRRKTFHFLQLKSLQSFRDRKVCGWDEEGLWLRWLFTWSLHKLHSQMLLEEKVEEWGTHSFLHGASSAEFFCSVWTRLSASCICCCLVFQCCVSSFQGVPEWGRGFMWLHTGLDATAVFCTFPSLRKARLVISCCQWNTRTWMGCKTEIFIKVLSKHLFP